DRLPLLDHGPQTDEREAIPDLPDLSPAIHGIFCDRAACPAPQFLDPGSIARRVLPDQYSGIDAWLHRAGRSPIPDAVADGKTVQSDPRPRLRAALHHHRDPV